MPQCFICQSPTDRVVTFSTMLVPACNACVQRATAHTCPACPTCNRRTRSAGGLGRPRRSEPERNAFHEQRVIDVLDPGAPWREIVRLTRLSTSDAQRARDRLLASGRIVLYQSAEGRVGARYCLPDHPEALALQARLARP